MQRRTKQNKQTSKQKTKNNQNKQQRVSRDSTDLVMEGRRLLEQVPKEPIPHTKVPIHNLLTRNT
jgi:hypothetical protein